VTRVVSVSSSRADVGVLAPVWAALSPRAELHLLLTGMHLAENAPHVESVPSGATVHRGGADLGGAGGGMAASAMAAIAEAAGMLYARVAPDAVLVIGDRLDMLPAATATLPFNIPLVHLHGGEVTEGAVDDRIRHAMTKLAHMHCVSSEGARRRLLAMGEEADRIVVTGAPGLDTLNAAPLLPASEFAREAGVDGIEGDLRALRLVTVHPETNAADPLAPLYAVLAALDARPAPTLFTASNSDPGGEVARRRIEAFVAARRWARFKVNLGSQLYPNALRHAALMLGNSSSGIIEAGLFGLPVVNVGARQAGRERGTNVIDVANSAAAVIAALDRLGPVPARAAPATPYGSGGAGPKVADLLLSLPPRARMLAKPAPREAARA
jgi:UDP-hydrolysing UDP-N-acetyl-D-glucosamine 2-epimerase